MWVESAGWIICHAIATGHASDEVLFVYAAGRLTRRIHSLTDAVRLSTAGSVANGWVHVSTVGRNHGTVQAATVACGSEND